jgi:hypothetical protein
MENDTPFRCNMFFSNPGLILRDARLCTCFLTGFRRSIQLLLIAIAGLYNMPY